MSENQKDGLVHVFSIIHDNLTYFEQKIDIQSAI